jgi:hypothetical protein
MLENGQADTGARPVTKRYTTPTPAFRQVFAQSASEGVATAGRVEVLAVLVNGTVVLGKCLIQIGFCKGDAVRTYDIVVTLSDATFAGRIGIFARFWGENTAILAGKCTFLAVKRLWKSR